MQLNSSVATRSAAHGLILGVMWVVAAGALWALSGCGQKGPLTLPGAAARAAPSGSATAASAPAGASAPAR